MQDVKQEWFKNLRRIVPAVKVESLKAGERKRVLGVVKEKSVLPPARPTVQPFLQVEPVTLLVTLNEHAEEAEEKLQILFGLLQGEWIDSEIPRLLAYVQVR